MGTVHRFTAHQSTAVRQLSPGNGRAPRVTAGACPVCCSFHAEPAECPGELRATGPERHGWRVNVETPNGLEAYGVLVAPSLEVWRARVITFPNILWIAPGGYGSLKFFGSTAQEAERRAIAFVERHCALNGYLRRDGMTPVATERVQPEAVRPGVRPAPLQSTRKMHVIPVRFGVSRPATLAQTLNVSDDGMFVGTPVPLARGDAALLRLDVQGVSLPLAGIVMWNRARIEPGRPLGMGLRLVQPPAAYARYVQALP